MRPSYLGEATFHFYVTIKIIQGSSVITKQKYKSAVAELYSLYVFKKDTERESLFTGCFF